MRRRTFLKRLEGLVVGVAVLALGRSVEGTLAAPAGATCPRCGAPLEPGAAFCVRCGLRLDAPAPPAAGAPDATRAVVQVVAVRDAELTSTFASLAFQSNLRVDSILGSAFAIAPGEFATDSSLLVGAKEVSLRTAAGRSFAARVAGADPMIGVALLRSDIPDVGVLPLRLDHPPEAGESLDALGFTGGASAAGRPLVSTGVVSGLHRSGAGIHPVEDLLQTDASLPPGLAGGPMVDSQGRVVGMSSGLVLGSRVFLGPQSGIGYAVPAEWIARALAWIRSGASPRCWLGAYAIAADPESRARFRLPPEARLVIDQVFPDSPAAAGGLLRGDGILKLQDEEVSTLVRLQERLLARAPGDSVTLSLARGGAIRSVTLTLAPRPEKPRLAGIDALRFFGGVEVLPRGDDRLVVAALAPGADTSHQKIAPGDVLQSVLSKKDWLHGPKDNSRWRSVHTVEDLETRLRTAYSDLDFCLGLRFRSKDGDRKELFVWEILTPTAAL